MTSPPEASTNENRPRVGRPPRINRPMIAQAAHELGLEGLTLKAVAQHLDVSIAALYHHVASKDDLMRLAAEYSATKVPLPVDRGQHWAQWLYEWAAYNRDVFLAQPGLLAQFLDGAIPHEVIAERVDVILGVLMRGGFTTLEANGAYELITSCAIGTTVSTLHERAAAEAGHPILATHPAAGGPEGTRGGLPHLGQLIADGHRPRPRVSFHSRIVTVLFGIAWPQGPRLGARSRAWSERGRRSSLGGGGGGRGRQGHERHPATRGHPPSWCTTVGLACPAMASARPRRVSA